MKRVEQEIQKTIVRHLQVRCAPNVVWFHCPSGGYRRPAEAAIFTSLGTKAGVSDLIFLHQGRFFALELKSAAGKISPAQRKFLDDVSDAGGFAAVAYGLDEAIRFLESWKILRGEMQ